MSASRVSKLKWICRRGMKELDVLLERFLQQQNQALINGSWPQLESLLETEDDQLWDWLQQPSCEQATAYRELLEVIRSGAE
jgi:antitoxin CptB